MKWTEKEKVLILELIAEGEHSFNDIALKLGRSKSSVRGFINKLGYKESDFFIKKTWGVKKCMECEQNYSSLISKEQKFCSQSCSAKYNNKLRVDENNKTYLKCLFCEGNKKVKTSLFCSNTCYANYNREIIFHKIESGDTEQLEKYYKLFLIKKHGDKCMECGWCKINPVTNKIPIQLEHIDGNYKNNSLDNLKILCPNCHSLTSTYGNLNRGNGRPMRHK